MKNSEILRILNRVCAINKKNSVGFRKVDMFWKAFIVSFHLALVSANMLTFGNDIHDFVFFAPMLPISGKLGCDHPSLTRYSQCGSNAYTLVSNVIER